jgi:lipid-binding SYLF domain-containing protein
MSVVEVGAVFSGSIGSGILIRKNPIFGMKWSPPCACGLHGASFGLAIGGPHKDFLIFLLDNDSVRAIASGQEFSFGAQNSHVLGYLGHLQTLDFNNMNSGVISVSFSDGAFLGVSLEGANVTPNQMVNDHCYGQPVMAEKFSKE